MQHFKTFGWTYLVIGIVSFIRGGFLEMYAPELVHRILEVCGNSSVPAGSGAGSGAAERVPVLNYSQLFEASAITALALG